MKIVDDKLLVKVKLGGKQSVWEDALIDTGSAFTVIPPEISDFLELRINRKCPKVRLVTASGLIEPEVRIMDRLTIGDIEIERILVVIHEIPDPAPIKVLLGMNFVKRINLYVKGKDNTFQIEESI